MWTCFLLKKEIPRIDNFHELHSNKPPYSTFIFALNKLHEREQRVKSGRQAALKLSTCHPFANASFVCIRVHSWLDFCCKE